MCFIPLCVILKLWPWGFRQCVTIRCLHWLIASAVDNVRFCKIWIAMSPECLHAVPSGAEILKNLMSVASLERLKSVRTVVFEYAIGTIIECEDPERHIYTSQYKLKQRCDAKAAATTAMITVQLFSYICGINGAFVVDALVESWLSTVTVTARANDAEVCPDAIYDESPGNSHGRPPPTPPSSPSQDIEWVQRSFDDDATTPSQDGVPSIIGSPFLNDDGVEPAPRAHSSPAMRSDCSTAHNSISTCSTQLPAVQPALLWP